MITEAKAHMTINVRITGGLGNQLFKFFHGIYLSELFLQPLVLDRTWYRDPRDRRNLVSSRDFDLAYYPRIREVKSVEWKSAALNKKFGQVLRRLHPSIQTSLGYMVENNRSIFLDKNLSPNFVDGSFEDVNFLPAPDTILHYLSRSEKSAWLESNLNDVHSSRPIAVHVRRGDFMNLPQMYDVVSLSYYQSAISSAQKIYGRKQIHLFTDDPESAKVFLGKDFRVDKVIHQEPTTQTAEIFELLSRYPIVIGANSTFSWWAGFLGHLRGDCAYYTMPNSFLGPNFIDPSINLRHPGAVVFPN